MSENNKIELEEFLRYDVYKGYIENEYFLVYPELTSDSNYLISKKGLIYCQRLIKKNDSIDITEFYANPEDIRELSEVNLSDVPIRIKNYIERENS